MKALLAMPDGLPARLFDPAQLGRLAQLADIDPEQAVPDLAAAADGDLQDVEVLRRLTVGEPPRHPVDPSRLDITA